MYSLRQFPADRKRLRNNQQPDQLIIYANVNALKADTSLKNTLTRQLLGIYEDDQKYRQQLEGTFIKYGMQSKEVHELADQMNRMDTLNLVKVTAILDQYGWVGKDLVGQDGNSALYLVIQHADAKTRAKYLPMIRDAVKKNNALASDLATLEDRVLLEQHKKQIYGTQISLDTKTGKYTLDPLEDPEHVNEKRARGRIRDNSKQLS
ncbi:DUF6624 domain-containing protein [Pedobacter sp. NJ-S-72]